MSEQQLRIAIKDIELKSVQFSQIESMNNEKRNLKIVIPEKNIEQIENECHVDIFGEFEIYVDNIYIKGESEASLVLVTSDIEQVRTLMNEHKYQVAYPLISKICSLIAKVSEDMRTIPIVISPVEWIETLEASEKDI